MTFDKLAWFVVVVVVIVRKGTGVLDEIDFLNGMSSVKNKTESTSNGSILVRISIESRKTNLP